MAFQNVHIPLQVPKRYSDKYSFIDNEDRRTYAGMVDILDEAVGNITQAMKDAGYDNCFACRVIYAPCRFFPNINERIRKSYLICRIGLTLSLQEIVKLRITNMEKKRYKVTNGHAMPLSAVSFQSTLPASIN